MAWHLIKPDAKFRILHVRESGELKDPQYFQTGMELQDYLSTCHHDESLTDLAFEVKIDGQWCPFDYSKIMELPG